MDGTVVMGLGGTVDFELHWDPDALGALAREHRIRRDELTTTAPIVDERSLLVCILAVVVSGVGAERFVASSDVITAFCARFDHDVTLGGTGVRAGLVLDALGVPTVQHLVSIDDTVRRMLPSSVRYVCSADSDSLDPHLIVQFPAGAKVRIEDVDVVAPAANRLIAANDPPNREMAIATELRNELATARAFLISGFNTMQDDGVLIRRLDQLGDAMTALPADAMVYYEDAGFYDRRFSEIVRNRLSARIDVHGMNEDEMQEYAGRSVDLLDPSDVVDALTAVQVLIQAPALVVHTRYWAIAVGTDAHRYERSLEKAVTIAATRYRLGDGFTAQDAADTDGFPRHVAGRALVESVRRGLPGSRGVAAFAVDSPGPTTIGLGDSFVGGFFAGMPDTLATSPSERAD